MQKPAKAKSPSALRKKMSMVQLREIRMPISIIKSVLAIALLCAVGSLNAQNVFRGVAKYGGRI